MQVAHDKSQGILEKSAQRAFKIFGVIVAVGMNGNSRKADAFCHELRKNQLRLFGKKQHSGQIEISIASGEVQILQQAQLFCVDIREVTVIPLFQKIPEQQLVQFVNARLCGQFIGMELAGILKKTAQFLF